MKFFLKGPAGHPLHPPLTDVTVGVYTFATAMAVLSRLGVSEHNTATALYEYLTELSAHLSGE